MILGGINVAIFSQYKNNPEDFILKAGTLINEQKATVIVEHLVYNPLEETYSTDIFTQEKRDDLSKGFKAQRHIYDYVFTDSANERTFVGELDATSEVVVYAKLPKAFQIPTPVGKLQPRLGYCIRGRKSEARLLHRRNKGLHVVNGLAENRGVEDRLC